MSPNDDDGGDDADDDADDDDDGGDVGDHDDDDNDDYDDNNDNDKDDDDAGDDDDDVFFVGRVATDGGCSRAQCDAIAIRKVETPLCDHRCNVAARQLAVADVDSPTGREQYLHFVGVLFKSPLSRLVPVSLNYVQCRGSCAQSGSCYDRYKNGSKHEQRPTVRL